jgi:hypothetical protein
MTAFDPYDVWLGIGPDEQPASHYRLLGLRAFESNADVIDHAADRHTAHLKSFAAGERAAFAQKLLGEINAARVCLLDAKAKAEYDAKLRGAKAVATPSVISVTAPKIPLSAAPVKSSAPIPARSEPAASASL